jgi:hypothetical protein
LMTYFLHLSTHDHFTLSTISKKNIPLAASREKNESCQ